MDLHVHAGCLCVSLRQSACQVAVAALNLDGLDLSRRSGSVPGVAAMKWPCPQVGSSTRGQRWPIGPRHSRTAAASSGGVWKSPSSRRTRYPPSDVARRGAVT